MKTGLKFYLCVVSIACVSFLTVALNACAQGDASAATRQQRMQMVNEHYAKGKELNQQGNYAAANEEFKKAQDLLAGTEEAVMPQPTPAAAEKSIEQAQAPAPALPAPAAVPQKPAKQTAKQKNKELAKTPPVPEDIQKQAENYFRAALESSRKGESEQAISFYKQAVSLTPNNPNLLYNMAVEYLKLSKFNEAAGLFKAVVELNPKEKDAYYNLGVIYDSYLGDKDTAKFYYTKYLKFATKSDDIREVRGWIAQIDKDKKELQ
jgi:tetratricopeptide (TPR) repeat protein